MKALVITPKDAAELKFLSELLKKMGIASAEMPEDELEDLGLSQMMRTVDRSKKVSKATIVDKLKS
jgi:hypothetical protein